MAETSVPDAGTPQPGGREIAPGHLRAVQAFVNTLDLGRRTDALDSPAALGWWLRTRGLLDAGEELHEAVDLARARAVREALRETLRRRPAARGSRGDAVGLAARRVLEAQALRSRLTLDAAADGTLLLTPRADGLDGALGRLLALVAAAQGEGSWPRLKVCTDDGCEWAFWDSSRNRSGRWCSMAVCGNRTKVRAHRLRMSGQQRLPL